MVKSFPRRSSCQNPPSTGKDGLAGAALGPAPTNSSDISIPAPAVSRVPTPAPPVAPIVGSSLALALVVAFATTSSLDN